MRASQIFKTHIRQLLDHAERWNVAWKQYEDDLKNEEELKNEDDLKIEDNLKYEDNCKNEDDQKN